MIGLKIFKINGSTQVLSGIWLVALTAMAALYAADIPLAKALGLSPLLLAIIIGLFYGNTLCSQLPSGWAHGVRYCTKYILRSRQSCIPAQDSARQYDHPGNGKPEDDCCK